MEVFRDIRLTRDLAGKLREQWKALTSLETTGLEVPQDIQECAAHLLANVLNNREAQAAVIDAAIEWHTMGAKMLHPDGVMEDGVFALPIDEEVLDQLAEFAHVRAHLSVSQTIRHFLAYALDR